MSWTTAARTAQPALWIAARAYQKGCRAVQALGAELRQLSLQRGGETHNGGAEAKIFKLRAPKQHVPLLLRWWCPLSPRISAPVPRDGVVRFVLVRGQWPALARAAASRQSRRSTDADVAQQPTRPPLTLSCANPLLPTPRLQECCGVSPRMRGACRLSSCGCCRRRAWHRQAQPRRRLPPPPASRQQQQQQQELPLQLPPLPTAPARSRAAAASGQAATATDRSPTRASCGGASPTPCSGVRCPSWPAVCKVQCVRTAFTLTLSLSSPSVPGTCAPNACPAEELVNPAVVFYALMNCQNSTLRCGLVPTPEGTAMPAHSLSANPAPLALVAPCSYEGRVQLADDIWKMARSRGDIPFDVEHFNAYLRAHLFNQQVVHVPSFLKDMAASGISPNRVSQQRQRRGGEGFCNLCAHLNCHAGHLCAPDVGIRQDW